MSEEMVAVRPRPAFCRRLIVLGLLAIGLYAVYVVFFGTPPEWTAISSSCRQPESISYADGTYTVAVRKPSVSLTLSPGPMRAVVGRAGGGYGVWITLNQSPDDPGAIRCRWTSEVVQVIEADGIVHTVPASTFKGGR